MESVPSDRSTQIKIALAEVRANGVRLGNPDPLPALRRARSIHAEEARQFAADHLPLIWFLQDQGLSYRAIARALNQRGAPTLRGRSWQAAQVSSIFQRARPPLSANPFYVEGPAVVSFSGGRTSAFMLRQILDAAGGTLPNRVSSLCQHR